jgi:8-oxo-dGTP diphosphatase
VSPERHRARLSTIAFLCRGDAVLLLRHPEHKARFAGLWDGIGGHVEAGEDVREAARREVREEAGIDVPGLRLRGVLHESGMQGHHYVVFLFVGEAPAEPPRSPEGLELRFFARGELDRLPLVEDLRHWLPALLEAREPMFLTERYDGGDGLLSVRMAGREVFARVPEGASR